jgi:hypothetical protein
MIRNRPMPFGPLTSVSFLEGYSIPLTGRNSILPATNESGPMARRVPGLSLAPQTQTSVVREGFDDENQSARHIREWPAEPLIRTSPGMQSIG